MNFYEFWKYLFINIVWYPSIFILLIVILTFVISLIYSFFMGISLTRTFVEIFIFYGNFLYNFFIIIYTILSIPYNIIKIFIDIFHKFAIIFYFIINFFNGLATFIYDITTVEI